ncbi:putative signal transducing protein [Cochleicola gelatinilyticus]|uniref:DUF2007 domain-containing protein n=1 Tax=Cochleicola gelatinilyticus TaxID=1763537 RepID=A0A167GMV0_9FLAO|nr:DUF2007 domain-containing protein [Cochleicola gelatinilyticus]OAB77726.1 hypothetical protein ULVI_12365 [Cochleicola gelatinilyticus]
MNKKFVDVYSGSEVQVILLKGLLENIDIEGIIQNDFQSGITAGFGGGTVNTVRLKLHESDLKKAQPVIEKFIKNQ